ncbi:MAG TPA: hypothetical protein VF511_05610, partial [Chthoniobacterales bacterium]
MPRNWISALDVQFYPAMRDAGRDFFSNLAFDPSAVERRLACEQLVDCRAERINVVEVARSLARELLRAHINKSAARASRLRKHANRIGKASRDSEIG